LEQPDWERFMKLLDRPAQVPAGLRRLFSKPSVFELGDVGPAARCGADVDEIEDRLLRRGQEATSLASFETAE
jgi:hypothetical protein